MQMRKKLSAILLAAGLSVSLLCAPVWAAETEQAGTEAGTESEIQAAGNTVSTDVANLEPRNVTGDGQYAMFYPTFEQSIEQTLDQLSQFTDEQIAQYMDSSDLATSRLVATWDTAREACGRFEGINYYDVEEEGNNLTFTMDADYEAAKAVGSKVTVQVLFNMKDNSTSYSWNVKETLGRSMRAAGMNTVIGILTVFVTLVFLSFLIYLFRFIPNGEKKSRKDTEVEAAKAAAVPAAEPVIEEEETDDLELIAVISAAIAAAEGSSVPEGGYVVRSIKRRGKRSAWQ